MENLHDYIEQGIEEVIYTGEFIAPRYMVEVDNDLDGIKKFDDFDKAYTYAQEMSYANITRAVVTDGVTGEEWEFLYGEAVL